jgi:hypothetical protein
MKREYGSGNALIDMIVLILCRHDCSSSNEATSWNDI